MTGVDVLILLLIAAIIGALAEAIVGFSPGGLLVSIAVGFVGAVLGTWLARKLGLPEMFAIKVGTQTIPVIWSIIGATIFVAIIRAIRTPLRRRSV